MPTYQISTPILSSVENQKTRMPIMYDDHNYRCNSYYLSHLASTLPYAQPYREIEQDTAVAPLDFPIPTLGCGEHWSNIVVVDHINGQRLLARHLIVAKPQNNLPPDHAYLTKKRLGKSTFGGQMRLCMVVRPKGSRILCSDPSSSSGTTVEEEWETTDQLVVLKSALRQYAGRNRLLLKMNPLDEISAQQYVGDYHPHVLGCYEAFQDDDYIYSVLPYCPGRDLYSTLVVDHNAGDTDTVSSSNSSTSSLSSSRTSRRLVESRAREWFCHLLDGLTHLQKKGVCHGGLCLENILSSADGNLVIADFGLALRIPYDNEFNKGGGGVTDVSEGSSRRLMRCRVSHSVHGGTGGNHMYMAPEYWQTTRESSQGNNGMSPNRKSREEYCTIDGFAVDLWSLGVILFVMLTGSAPFRLAHESDPHFVQISKRGLLYKLPSLQDASPAAIDILQSMLWADPTRRLTLHDLLCHPWVSPPNILQCDSFDSQQDCNDSRTTKKRLHHLSYVKSLGGTNNTVIQKIGGGAARPGSIM